VVSHIAWPLLKQYPSNRWLVRYQGQSECSGGEENLFPLPEIEPQI